MSYQYEALMKRKAKILSFSGGKKRPVPSFGRNALLSTGLAASLLFGSYKAVDRYSAKEFDARYDSYAAGMIDWKSTPIFVEKPEMAFVERLNKLHAIMHAEKRMGETVDELKEYFAANKEKVARLTNEDFEKGGFVAYADGKFDIVEVGAWNQEAARYIDEMLGGNFAHAGQFLGYIEKIEALAKSKVPDIAQRLPKEIGNLKNCSESDRIDYTNDDGRVFYLSTEDTQDACKQTSLRMEGIGNILKNLYDRGDIDYSDGRVMVLFHSHPSGSGPSPPDVAATYISGPEIVFTRQGNVLRAYSVVKGKVTEIYASEAK